MTDNPSLFDFAERYPNQPGHRRTATSKAAAEAIKPRAPTLRDQVLALLKFYEAGLTADECAKQLGNSILGIRPRLSELKTLGKIYDSGITRANESGVQASVWRAF
jgi:hypothetical protein